MKMYLVRRYVNELGRHNWGVANSNHLVGLFTNEEAAKAAKEKAEAEAKTIDFENEYECHETEIYIIEVEVDQAYKTDEQIYLGGGRYVE